MGQGNIKEHMKTEMRIVQGELYVEFDAVPTKNGWKADGYGAKRFTSIGFVEGDVTASELSDSDPGMTRLFHGPAKLVIKSNRLFVERV
jgi:hypothetical protein